MTPLSYDILEYKQQLKEGYIQKAYRGIISFLTGLMSDLHKKHKDYTLGTLYTGYMDMSYFAFTPQVLKEKKLKVALVYLHEEGRFEAWLSGMNRRIQAEYISRLREENLGSYVLSVQGTGVDSILSSILLDTPDFDVPDQLNEKLEEKLLQFIEDMSSILARIE